MILQIVKIGNSKGVILPAKTLEYLGLTSGDYVDLHIEGSKKNQQ